MNSQSPPNDTGIAWFDTPQNYGRISRLLHWSMVLLFIWQFAGMILKVTLGWHPRDSWMLGTHATVGTILWFLLVLRALWAAINFSRRPSYGKGLLARCASLGHFALYALMFIVPTLALIRQYGSGRGLRLFDSIQVFSAGEAIPALTQWVNSTRESLGGSLHGLTGWLLLIIIVGHIGMVVVHHFIWKDGTANKMIGRPKN